MVPQKKEAILPLKDFSSSSGVSFTEQDVLLQLATCCIHKLFAERYHCISILLHTDSLFTY